MLVKTIPLIFYFLVHLLIGYSTSFQPLNFRVKSFRHSVSFLPEKAHDLDTIHDEIPHLAFLGGGIFFYWQAGVITYMREQGYDLSEASSTGASAGALAATLTACDVDFYEATDLALQMARDAGVWDRSGGLQGIWGPMIRDWLDILLPQDAVLRMNNTSLLVTPIPQFGKQRISTYTDRQDVIDCNMASVHLPLFLDGKWAAQFRSGPYVDGSFLSNQADYEPTNNRETLYLSHRNDERYRAKGLLSFVNAVNPEGIYEMIEDGKAYAKILDEQGCLSKFPRTRPSILRRDKLEVPNEMQRGRK